MDDSGGDTALIGDSWHLITPAGTSFRVQWSDGVEAIILGGTWEIAKVIAASRTVPDEGGDR